MKDEKKTTEQPQPTTPAKPQDERTAFVASIRGKLEEETAEILKASVDPNKMEEGLTIVMLAVAACRANLLAKRLDEIRHSDERARMADTLSKIVMQAFDLVDEKPDEGQRGAQ